MPTACRTAASGIFEASLGSTVRSQANGSSTWESVSILTTDLLHGCKHSSLERTDGASVLLELGYRRYSN